MAKANHKSSITADPIYLAIERHKNAARLWAAAVDVWAKFPDGPEPMTRERRIERERINDAWREARGTMDKQGVDLINTAPTTVAGIVAALGYMRDQLRDDGDCMPQLDAAAVDTIGWVDVFVNTLAGAAGDILARQGDRS